MCRNRGGRRVLDWLLPSLIGVRDLAAFYEIVLDSPPSYVSADVAAF